MKEIIKKVKKGINSRIHVTTQDIPTQTTNGKIVFTIGTVKIIVGTMVEITKTTKKKIITLGINDPLIQQKIINVTLCPYHHWKSPLNWALAPSEVIT